MIDNFGQKMVNSGHSIKEVRRNILHGLKGWRSKMDRCKSSNQPVHRSAKESAASRRHKKLTGKSTWFKEKGKAEEAGEVINDCPDDRNITNSVRVNIARDVNEENEKAEEARELINDCSDDRNINNSVRVNIARDTKKEKGKAEEAGELINELKPWQRKRRKKTKACNQRSHQSCLLCLVLPASWHLLRY